MSWSRSIRPGVRLDTSLEGIWQGTQFQPIPVRTYRILQYLMRHRGHVIAQATLLHVGWPDDLRDTQDLYRHIHRIRQIIEPDPQHPRWLLTHKDSGYVLMTTPQLHGQGRKTS